MSETISATELSYVSGASSPPLIDRTIGAQLDQTAALHGASAALVIPYQNVRWNWSELRERVDALACGLVAQGLAKGDRIGIWAPNCAEWILTQLAAAKVGLILVTINPAYRVSEVCYALNKVGCRALVMAAAHKGSDYIAMLREIGPAHLPQLELVLTLGEQEHGSFMPFGAVFAPVDPDMLASLAAAQSCHDPVNIQFTSGTTGSPKGATLTHHNILNNGALVGERIGLGVDDRICVPVPLYHCFGMVMGNLAALTHGSTVVYPAESFDPLAVLSAIEAEGCTALYGVPTMFISMLGQEEFDRFDLSSLRTGIMAGSPCPVTTMRDVMDRMHMPEVTIAYGMTETSPVSFQSNVDTPLDERVSTVGRIQPHLEAKIVDDKGHICARGVQGELCTRGYSVMAGYWGDAERTAEAIDHDSWMHTGDLATIDEGGYCRITGRIKDMIIRGGENIYPREIEEFLLTHPAISDAQIFGVPDGKYGEQVCAWIIPKCGALLTEQDVRLFCKGKIAHYKTPHFIRIVDSFPMTITGKVQKFVMRQAMMALSD